MAWLVDKRLPNQAAGEIFTADCARDVPGIQADTILRRSHDVRSDARMGAGHCPRNRFVHAALYSGSAPLPAAVLDEFEALFPHRSWSAME